MRTIAISVLVAAATAFAGTASAQQAPPPEPANPALNTGSYNTPEPPWTGDLRIPGPDIVSRMEFGVSALKAMDYAQAEEIFAKVLRTKPTNADANFYMGVAKMNLGEWEDARKHLEIAVRKKPKHPDPKSRLGVTYAKLGETAAAATQRADLERLAQTCKRSCKGYTPFIAGGIEMIDEALGGSTVQGQG